MCEHYSFLFIRKLQINLDLEFLEFSFFIDVLMVFVMSVFFLLLASCQASVLFDETSKSPLYEKALDSLKTEQFVGPDALAWLGMASRSDDSHNTYFWPEMTLAFLRRYGRGLVESCDDAGFFFLFPFLLLVFFSFFSESSDACIGLYYCGSEKG
jgi:hypothetical protein